MEQVWSYPSEGKEAAAPVPPLPSVADCHYLWAHLASLLYRRLSSFYQKVPQTLAVNWGDVGGPGPRCSVGRLISSPWPFFPGCLCPELGTA